MSQVAQRSSYGQSTASNAVSSSAAAAAPTETTSHYAYSLVRDDEGKVLSGKDSKAYLNQAKINEVEGQFGLFQKMVVNAVIPVGTYFIARKKDAPVLGASTPIVREEGDTSTTHYAYSLVKNEEGGISGKEFLNQAQIWENEGKFGSFQKMIVNSPISEGTYFIAQKRAK